MPLLNNPVQFENIVRHLRRTSVFRHVCRYDLARVLRSLSLVNAVKGQVIASPSQDPNPPSAPSFFILLTGDYDLDGGLRLGGLQDGLAGIEDVVQNVPRSITLTAKSNGTYLEVPAAEFRSAILGSTPLRQSLVPILNVNPAPTTYVQPVEGHARGNIVEFITTIVDTPLSLLIEFLAREIATNFADHVIVLRACAPGQQPSLAPIQVQGPVMGELWYAFVDPLANPNAALSYADQFDYVFLDGVPSSSVDTIAKLFFGYPQDYVAPPAVGSPRLLQTVVIGQPPLPCSSQLYFVNANPTRTTHASDCRIRLDLVKLRALDQVWNPYMPFAVIDVDIAREMGVWARAVTHRRTGIALAGGGVWSMQSVFILQEFESRGIPLDVITATSSGALIGAYYSVLGSAGLNLLVQRGDSGMLDLLVGLSIFGGCFSSAMLDRDLGSDACLDNLMVDFRPNSTNLTAGEGVAFTRGPVNAAVRAAAASPPLTPPTFSGEQRFVDGAFSNNLAAQILPYFGANLTFGSNTYPPSRRPASPWVPNFVTRIASYGPLSRLTDFTIALNLLANLTGKVEGGYADVLYDASSNFPFPFLITPNFRLSSKMVAHAAQDPGVLAAVDQFTVLWNHSRRRGGRTWTTTPS